MIYRKTIIFMKYTPWMSCEYSKLKYTLQGNYTLIIILQLVYNSFSINSYKTILYLKL